VAYAFDLPEPPALPIEGGDDLFPVRRVYCVGRNYAEHAKEMGHDPDREPPFFFMKPADAVVAGGGKLPFPPATGNLHHEVELVVALGPEAAIFGQAVGIDLTRRDLQDQAKKAGRPWEMGKAFDRSAPCGPLTPASKAMTAGAITLEVNGETRQRGDIGDLIWSVDEVLKHLAGYVELKAGDLIFTGTPAGVGRIEPGDTLLAEVEGLRPLEVTIG
jgi:fumarylpyruvate hydrolase